MCSVSRRELLKLAALTPAFLGFGAAAASWRAAPVSAAYTGAFYDDFTGPAGTPPNPAYWSVWSNFSSGGVAPSTPANVYQDGNSHLVLKVTNSASGYQGAAVAGASATGNPILLSFGYGTIAARIRYPEGFVGAWPCFWAVGADYPTVGWPACGEIDVAEFFGTSTGYYATLHGPGGYASNSYDQAQAYVPATTVGATDLAAGFHTYWITRTLNRLTVGIDAITLATCTPAQLTPAGAQWALNQNVVPIFDFLLTSTPTGATFPATMLVDWIKYTPAFPSPVVVPRRASLPTPAGAALRRTPRERGGPLRLIDVVDAPLDERSRRAGAQVTSDCRS